MATVASRRGLEALCRDQGVTGGNLERKLARLHQDGKIDGRLADWATHLRHVGNEGAHDLDFEPDRGEAIDAQALLIGVLRYVYVEQARYEDAKRRWEYRQLPSVEIAFEVVTYINGCQTVGVLKPKEAQQEEDAGAPMIGAWTRHKVVVMAPPHPNVDITADIWAQCRATTAEWLQVRGLRIADWTGSSPTALPQKCAATVHGTNVPWEDSDDEPPF